MQKGRIERNRAQQKQHLEKNEIHGRIKLKLLTEGKNATEKRTNLEMKWIYIGSNSNFLENKGILTHGFKYLGPGGI